MSAQRTRRSQNSAAKNRAILVFCQKNLFYPNINSLQEKINSLFVKKLGFKSANLVSTQSKTWAKYDSLVKIFEEKPELKEQALDAQSHAFALFGTEGKISALLLLQNKAPLTRDYEYLRPAIQHIELALQIIQHTNKATANLKNSYKKLKHIDAAKDDFINVAAHELKTPLSIIQGYSDFLLSGRFGELNTQQKEFMQKIFHGSRDMLSLVRDVLNINKLESGKMDFNFLEIVLVDFLKELANNFKMECEKRQLNLVLQNQIVENLKIKTDPEKLKIVLNNLLSNACKFTPAGGSITVRATLENEAKRIRIEVIDTGIGIPAEKHSEIFQKFKQVANPLQQSGVGSGLGLSIAKHIVEKLGGQIGFTSTPNQGSNFFFTLPTQASSTQNKTAPLLL